MKLLRLFIPKSRRSQDNDILCSEGLLKHLEVIDIRNIEGFQYTELHIRLILEKYPNLKAIFVSISMEGPQIIADTIAYNPWTMDPVFEYRAHLNGIDNVIYGTDTQTTLLKFTCQTAGKRNVEKHVRTLLDLGADINFDFESPNFIDPWKPVFPNIYTKLPFASKVNLSPLGVVCCEIKMC